MPERALVTGASGFVGANLARRLLADGHEVHLLLRPEHATWRLREIRDRVRCHEVDPSEAGQGGRASLLRRLIADIRPDWVFHLAAYGAYSSQADTHQMVRTNVLATVNLLEACLETGFQAFVNAGSSSEYGFKDHPPHETEWLEPNSAYAVTKAAATHFCRLSAVTHQAPIRTLRLYSAYGPYEEPTRLMPRLIVEGLAGRLPVLANPETARDYVHVDDVCTAFILAARREKQAPGAVYNVGTGVQTTLREVVDLARRVLTIPEEPKWGSMASRTWDTACWVADNRTIEAELGWRAETFENGFGAMVDWFRGNAAMRELYSRTVAGTH